MMQGLVLLLLLLPAHRAAHSDDEGGAKSVCDYRTQYDSALALMAASPGNVLLQRHCSEALARQAVGKTARAIAAAGGANLLCAGMQRFPQEVELQRSGCDVLGNLAEASGSAQAAVGAAGGAAAITAAMLAFPVNKHRPVACDLWACFGQIACGCHCRRTAACRTMARWHWVTSPTTVQ